jgi:SAM-dependent methyltransferase
MLARLYHIHHSLHPDDLPFWLDLSRLSSGPVLELGCGTGRVLLPLAQAGSRVIGIELDPEMLAVLRSQLEPSLRQQVALIQADFTRFRLDARFGLILMPCNTFTTLDAPARRALLENVFAQLAYDGCFVFEMPNTNWLKTLPASSSPEPEEVFPHPEDGEPVQVSSSWRRSRGIFHLRWEYDHLLPDGRVERLSAQVAHHLIDVEACLDEIHQAGFHRLQLFGGFDRSPFEADSPEAIVLASP